MIKKIKSLVRIISETKERVDLIEKLLRENEWNNVFNSAIIGSTWFNNTPLNIGRWAGNYSLLYILYRILNEIKPERILELGLGETTKMIQAYKQHHNVNAFCVTIEQSKEWIDLKLKNGILLENIKIVKADVESIDVKGFETFIYKDLPTLLTPFNKRFSLILIDGPLGTDNYSRYNIVELVNKGFLDSNFIIIVDDYNRLGEQQTVNDLREALTNLKYNYFEGIYEGDKNNLIIGSLNFQFLKTM